MPSPTIPTALFRHFVGAVRFILAEYAGSGQIVDVADDGVLRGLMVIAHLDMGSFPRIRRAGD